MLARAAPVQGGGSLFSDMRRAVAACRAAPCHAMPYDRHKPSQKGGSARVVHRP
jgi:hypothetical protein